MFDVFAFSGDPLTRPLKTMLMLHRLRDKFSPIINKYRVGRLSFEMSGLSTITSWYHMYVSNAWKTQGHQPSKNPSDGAADTDTSGQSGGGRNIL